MKIDRNKLMMDSGVPLRIVMATEILAFNYPEWCRSHKHRAPRTTQSERDLSISKVALGIADALIEAHNQTEASK